MHKRQLQRIQMKPRESAVEQYLVRRCAIIGWECLKLTCPNRRGVSDRLVIAYKGVMVVVEVKRPGGQESKLQVNWRHNLKDRGVSVAVVKSKEGIDQLMDLIQRSLDGVPAEAVSESGD